MIVLSSAICRGLTVTARIFLVIALLAITYLATSPSPPVSFSAWDKMNHFIAFAALAILADYSFPRSTWQKPVFLYLFIYGVALEVMQWMTKYRYLDHWDILANGVGLVAYLAVRPAINNIAILQQLHSAGDNQ